MLSWDEYETARAMLAWQVELGADEAILDAPVDRYAAPPPGPAAAGQAATGQAATGAPASNAAPGTVARAAPPPAAPAPEVDAVALARQAAQAAADLDGLRAAITAFEGCELKRGARNTVFADGNPEARVMIVGEAPGADEDRQGLPFVGRAGRMLDAMFAAIGLSRGAAEGPSALYITNVLPWRPPGNRDPEADEIAMLMPFVERHIALAEPDVLIAMGNISCHALIGRRGITRIRGQWAQAFGLPVLPMFHPAYLLRQPHAKRDAWSDLLSLQARLREAP
ncbi:uracil-DNA glycosylase [Mesobaculum littorinae]|uniref:Type-4 uracil-DNA glycosylase n=1 Tax=Mesobaculum littorinae TaxID=2486419 RepID=A0A438AI07_9RHOB|nr:uracil-DNA glycosylase [Mesobaculum littorinae]RVV98353.1 uracil-DNA glycosylase [Mesobaculum littorinae]